MHDGTHHYTPDRLSRLAANGYHCVALESGSKGPRVFKWTNSVTDWHRRDILPRYKFDNHGIGLLTGVGRGTVPYGRADRESGCRDLYPNQLKLYGLDVDIPLPLPAAAARRQLVHDFPELLDGAICKIGLDPKFTFLFASMDPMEKLHSAAFKFPGRFQVGDTKFIKAELLGMKQQTAAYHIHPDTGRPYRFEGGREPLNTPLEDLAVFAAADVHGMLDLVADVCRHYQLEQFTPATRRPARNGLLGKKSDGRKQSNPVEKEQHAGPKNTGENFIMLMAGKAAGAEIYFKRTERLGIDYEEIAIESENPNRRHTFLDLIEMMAVFPDIREADQWCRSVFVCAMANGSGEGRHPKLRDFVHAMMKKGRMRNFGRLWSNPSFGRIKVATIKWASRRAGEIKLDRKVDVFVRERLSVETGAETPASDIVGAMKAAGIDPPVGEKFGILLRKHHPAMPKPVRRQQNGTRRLHYRLKIQPPEAERSEATISQILIDSGQPSHFLDFAPDLPPAAVSYEKVLEKIRPRNLTPGPGPNTLLIPIDGEPMTEKKPWYATDDEFEIMKVVEQRRRENPNPKRKQRWGWAETAPAGIDAGKVAEVGCSGSSSPSKKGDYG